MSKAAASGGNLESILASIRRSLAEESTIALTEDASAPPPPPAPKVESDAEDAATAPASRREGLAKRLAETSPVPPPGNDDLSDLIVPSAEAFSRFDPVAALGPASAPEPARPAAEPKPEPEVAPAASPRAEAGDPLWFLAPGPEQEPAKAAEPAAASNEPTSRPDVVRASLPPFFGSSVEADKAEVVTAPPPPVIAPRPSAAAAEPASAKGREAAPVRLSAAAPVADPPAPAAVPPLRNGRASSLFDPPPVETVASAATADLSSKHGLEAVVVDMLRPMLRLWLDENMPRLVASALAEEAARNVRDPKKS